MKQRERERERQQLCSQTIFSVICVKLRGNPASSSRGSAQSLFTFGERLSRIHEIIEMPWATLICSIFFSFFLFFFLFFFFIEKRKSDRNFVRFKSVRSRVRFSRRTIQQTIKFSTKESSSLLPNEPSFTGFNAEVIREASIIAPACEVFKQLNQDECF